jgi:uncharacterized membrane protein
MGFSYGRLIRYFLQGILILAPISITIWAITTLFNFVDGILPNLIYQFFPTAMTDSAGQIRRMPGVGFVVVIALVLLGLMITLRLQVSN